MSLEPSRPALPRRPTPHPRTEVPRSPSTSPTPPRAASPEHLMAEVDDFALGARWPVVPMLVHPAPEYLAPMQPRGFSFGFGFSHPGVTDAAQAPSFAVPPKGQQSARSSSNPQPANPAGTGTDQTTRVVGMMDHDVLSAAQAMEAQGYSFVSATPLPPFQTALTFEHNPHTFQVLVGANDAEVNVKTMQMATAGWRYFARHRLGSFNQCVTYFR